MTLGEFRRATRNLPDDAVLIHRSEDGVFPYYAITGVAVSQHVRIMGSAYRELGLLEHVAPPSTMRDTVEVICGL